MPAIVLEWFRSLVSPVRVMFINRGGVVMHRGADICRAVHPRCNNSVRAAAHLADTQYVAGALQGNNHSTDER